MGGESIGYASPDPSAPAGSQQTFGLEWFTEELLDDQQTPRFSNGAYSITARADAGASSALSGVVSVNLNHTPRTAVLSQPANGAVVSGDVPIEARVSVWDGASLPSVELLISGTASGTVPLLWQPDKYVWVPDGSPEGGHWETQHDETRYVGTWLTPDQDELGNPLYPNGSYSLVVRAHGFAATQRDSASVPVTVSN